MMDRLEDELRRAMRREEPPPGFVEGVLARVAAQGTRRAGRLDAIRAWFQVPAMRWALAVCLLVAAGAAVGEWRAREERARGEAAKRQVMLALRITGSKLQFAQARVSGIGRDARRYTPRLERHL